MGENRKEQVRERYAGVARAISGVSGKASCCEPSYCGSDAGALEADMSGGSYSEAEKRELPRLDADASLGCGNPVALAALSPGEVVLDLGSGGGMDVLLSARRVAPGGKAYGLDMTGEMLDLARKNAGEAGVENVEFLEGEIEAVPLPEEQVDVIISNCVINLSTEKEKAIREAFRALKPGARFAVSDVVFLGNKGVLPAEVASSAELWAGCVSGALEKAEYEALLSAAGFIDVSVEITHTYPPESIADFLGPEGVEALRSVPVAGAFVRARKPAE